MEYQRARRHAATQAVSQSGKGGRGCPAYLRSVPIGAKVNSPVTHSALPVGTMQFTDAKLTTTLVQRDATGESNLLRFPHQSARWPVIAKLPKTRLSRKYLLATSVDVGSVGRVHMPVLIRSCPGRTGCPRCGYLYNRPETPAKCQKSGWRFRTPIATRKILCLYAPKSLHLSWEETVP